MSKLQTFDGTELDAVLARVRKEAGPDATITSATKIRSGGLGGFFSKEGFRVTVALPDGDAPEALPAGKVTFEPLTHVRLGEAMVEPPTSLLELADLVDEAEARTEARVPARPPAPTPAPEPVVPATRPAARTPSTEGASFNSVLRRLASEADLALDPAPGTAVLPARTAPVPARPSMPSMPLLPAMPNHGPEISSMLAGLGIPDHLLPTALTPAAAVIAMLHSLRLPAAPELPRAPGALTVVLGDRRSALALAHDLAAELGLKRTDIKVADPDIKGKATTLSRPEKVDEQRAAWTARPKVLAMTTPATRASGGWVWDMLAALAPDALWGIVGADRKCEDVEAWSDALGGFDALALVDLDQTVSPAAMLQVGIPIARLDGRPATTAAWAELLTARVAA